MLSKEILDLYNNFADAVYKPNALDGKTKELIALSNSITVDCFPCINYHYKKAVENETSTEEIYEACTISMSICAGSKKAKYSKIIKDLEKN